MIHISKKSCAKLSLSEVRISPVTEDKQRRLSMFEQCLEEKLPEGREEVLWESIAFMQLTGRNRLIL
jgi:hypothetical protein